MGEMGFLTGTATMVIGTDQKKPWKKYATCKMKK